MEIVEIEWLENMYKIWPGDWRISPDNNHHTNKNFDENETKQLIISNKFRVLLLRIHKQLKLEGFRRISKDFEGFYSISTASFVVWIDFSAHSYLETLQDRRLGFPKRPYF